MQTVRKARKKCGIPIKAECRIGNRFLLKARSYVYLLLSSTSLYMGGV